MGEVIYRPGPASDYENFQAHSESLSEFRKKLAEAAGVSEEEVHRMGPDTMEHLLSDLGIEVAQSEDK